MLRFSANLNFLFRELPLLARFVAAAECGFAAVEIAWADGVATADLASAAQDAGVQIVLCSAPVGDGMIGGLGLSGVPGRQPQFREAILWVAEFAQSISCPSINVGASRVPAGIHRAICLETLAENLGFAGDVLGGQGLRALVEPLNSHDFPGVLLSRADDALEVIKRCHSPDVFLQFDLYHMYQMHEDVLATLVASIDRVAHIQFADAPGRGEPGTGEIDFDGLFSALESLGYTGWIGAEYQTAGNTRNTLGWLRKYETRVPSQ